MRTVGKMDPDTKPGAGAGSTSSRRDGSGLPRIGGDPAPATTGAPGAGRSEKPSSRGGRLPHAARVVATPVILILVLLGPGLGGLAYRVAADRARDEQRVELEDRLTARAYDLRAKTVSILETLHAVKSFFDCSDLVTRDEFARYTRDARFRHPAIHVMEWIPRVPAAMRAAHEALVREEGVVGYEIRDIAEDGASVRAAARDVYFPVCYAEPRAGNEEAFGLDLASERVRRAGLRRAVESCEAVLTEPLALAQEREGAQSVLGFLPVFEEEGNASTFDDESLRGFVLVACRIPDLVRASERAGGGGGEEFLAFRLLDEGGDGRSTTLHASAGWTEEDAGQLDVPDREIRVAGQVWRLQGRPTPAWWERQRTYQPLVVGAVAFLLWELLCGFLILLGKRTRDRESRKQAQFIRSVLESLKEGVVVADGAGRVQFANDAAEHLMGVQAQAPPSAQWSETLGCYLPDTETPYPIEQMPLSRAVQGRHVIDEDMFVRGPAGESGIWLRVSASPILDEDETVSGGVVVFRDITERKKSEAAILRLSEAVEQTADAVIIMDRRGRIEYVNAAFEETTGYTRAEILGHTPRILGPDSYTEEQYRNLWRTIVRGNVYRTSNTTRRKDGQVYHVEQTITPMRDPHGAVTHFVSVARDVTEKKRRREQEFEMGLAAKVQQRMFPQAAPQVPGLDIAGAVFPAAETSGDYYDFVPMPDGGITLAIGDVSGHGFGPALLMAEARAYLRSLLAVHSGLDTVLDRLNHSLLVDLRTDHFVTLLLACVDREAGTLVHANAGHVPGYILDAGGAVKAELLGTGPILGIFDDRSYASGAPISVAPGDIVILLTDGITETPGAQDEFFGAEQALEVVRQHRHASAHEIIERLYHAVREYSNEAVPRDDATLVVCKVT